MIRRREPIIAECDSCGLPYVAGVSGGGSMALGLGGQSVHIKHMETTGTGAVKLEGVQVSCPRCGSMGSIPDGTYDFVRTGMRLLRDLTAEQGQVLIGSLREYQTDPFAQVEVDDALPEETKAFIVALLLKADKKFWVNIFIGMLAIILGYLGTQEVVGAIEQSRKQAMQQFQHLDENDRAICQELSEVMRAIDAGRPIPSTSRAVPPLTSMTAPKALPNRNDLCWCGSGRKFKRCHVTDAG